MTSATTHPASEELMAFLDGEARADAASIATHLDSCAECKSIAADLRRTSAALASWEVKLPSAVMRDEVLAEANWPAAAVGGTLRLASRMTWKRWALAGTGVALSLLLIAIVMPRIDLATRKRATRTLRELPEEKRTVNGPLAGKGHYQGWLDGKAPIANAIDDVASLNSRGAAGDSVAADANRSLGAFRKEKALSVGGQPAGRPTAQPQIVGQPMIARTANLSVVVAKFETARAILDAILVRYQAYAASLDVSTVEGSPRTINASLRVPAAQLGAALEDLKALGRVENESQSGEEVTEKHADLVARLKNSRETEVRLEDILRTRTGKVKDVLEVEREISRVRGEIEQMEAQQKDLEHRVDFATLNLTIAEEYKAKLESNAPSLGTRLRNSLVTGFRNAFGSFFSLVLFLAEAVPVLLIWLAILSPLGWLVRQRLRAVRAALI